MDGWSIPYNTKVDKDLLFEVIAASVSEDASKASIPAAYPARKGLDQSASPYAKAADATYDRDLLPAYKYGWETGARNPDTTFDQVEAEAVQAAAEPVAEAALSMPPDDPGTPA